VEKVVSLGAFPEAIALFEPTPQSLQGMGINNDVVLRASYH
jgi:hypothetical protein